MVSGRSLVSIVVALECHAFKDERSLIPFHRYFNRFPTVVTDSFLLKDYQHACNKIGVADLIKTINLVRKRLYAIRSQH